MIPTPSGYRKLGELNVDDQVIDESGRPCTITGIHDRTPSKSYRLGFSDGTTIDACDEHQWVTWTHADRKAYLRSPHEPDHSRFPDEWPTWRLARKHWGWLEERRDSDGPGPRVRTTQEIVDTLTYGSRSDLNHAIPTAGPLQLPDADLPVDPWLLGYWLGDGHTKAASLTVAEPDVFEMVEHLRQLGYRPTVYYPADRSPRIAVHGGLCTALRGLGVLGSKHVPDSYLWASVEQREALLRGLMDSDGYAERSKVEFISTLRPLAEAVVQLARSLGQKPVLAEGRATLNGRDCGPKFRVTWRPTRQPFGLARKAAKVDVSGGAQGLRNHHRMIISAEAIPPVPMRCLMVDGRHSMYLAGEAMIPTHNTHVGSNVLAEWATTTRGDYAMIAPTFGDARKICTEGPSGLVAALGPQLHHYNKSDYVLYLTNGSRIVLASADAPDRLRGYNLSGAWCDELASFGPEQKELWDKSLIPALRIGKHPRMIITTTPRRSAIVLRELLARAKNGDPSVHLTTGSTFENRDNLSAAFLHEMELRYKGTTVGRQELAGEMLDEVEGALVTQAIIEASRVLDGNLVPMLRRVVVGVDPCVTAGESSDACGIVVAGLGAVPMRGWTGTKSDVEGPHLYYFQDSTMRGTPRRWARRALEVADEWAADAIVIETNQGGDLCTTMLRMVATEIEARTPRIKKVHASVGKRTRAEPVAGMFEQYRAHMVGGIPGVEDGFTSWVPGDDTSPNELDAAVWAAVGLLPQLAMKGPAPVKLIA